MIMAKILHKGIESLLAMLKVGLEAKVPPEFTELPAQKDVQQYLSEHSSNLPDVVVLGPDVRNPVPLLQQLHAQDKTLSAIVVAEQSSYALVKQHVQLAPFIGSNVKVVENRAISLVLSEIEEAIRRTQQRRKYARLNFDLKKVEPSLAISGTVKQQYMDKFMELAPVGAVLLDNDLSIVALNRQASVFFSHREEIEGQRFPTLFPGGIQAEIEQFLREQSMNTLSVVKTVSIPGGGEQLFLDLLVSKDFRLDVPGYSIVILLDVTERITWQEALSSNEERLRMALEAGEMGTWDYNLVTGELNWDSRCRELFGLSQDADVNYDVFLKSVHPEDSETVHYAMQKALEGSDHGYYDTQYRAVGVEDGITRWIRAKGRVFFNGENVPVRFIGMVMDVSELMRSRRILEESIAEKNEFISIASHELKTPLTSLKAFVQLINEKLKQKDAEGSMAYYMKKVMEQVDKLNLLVSELLDLSKLESGKLRLNIQEFDFDKMVDDAIAMLQPSLLTHTIVKEGSAGVPVSGDRQRLEQVLVNYLANAAKYSPGKDKIVVSVHRNSSNVTVAVTDQGIGIPKEKISRIFERFYRVEGIVHRFQGFGIGLYIASEIIKRHNGRVWLESEEGKGSTFYFSIPGNN
jgi:PAS domain S-box-containing protein